MSSDKKKLNKTEKDRKNMVKENNNDESDFSENKIPDLNSLKPFEFEPKTNIRPKPCNFIKKESTSGQLLLKSNSDDEKEGAEYKVKRICNSEWCVSLQKQSLTDVLQNSCQACNFI